MTRDRPSNWRNGSPPFPAERRGLHVPEGAAFFFAASEAAIASALPPEAARRYDTRGYRVTLQGMLDILNIQGPKVQAQAQANTRGARRASRVVRTNPDRQMSFEFVEPSSQLPQGVPERAAGRRQRFGLAGVHAVPGTCLKGSSVSYRQLPRGRSNTPDSSYLVPTLPP